MGLSNSNLIALRVFPPNSILNNTLEFLEFLKYDTKQFRDETIVSKDDLFDALTKVPRLSIPLNLKKPILQKNLKTLPKNLTIHYLSKIPRMKFLI